jgi:hypothetical protein
LTAPFSDHHSTGPSGKLRSFKKIGPFFLVIASIIIGVLIVESSCQLFCSSIRRTQIVDKAIHRIIFFDGRDTIFRNQGDIFTYVPHSDIRNLTIFFSDNGFEVEYDYHFRTNNFGLVQDADITPGQASVLLLGDSFTEGQGAEPWFRLVSPEIEKLGYQAINGGLRGTGFEHWLKLERYLAANDVQIRKLVVLFISDDYQRPVRNFDPGELRCISTLTLCRGAESYYYRLPPPDELSSWIAKIRADRATITKRIWFKTRVEALLPGSYQVYKFLSERSVPAEQQSRAAIAELIRLYGPENVVFMHLPQEGEINGLKDLGLRTRHSIEEAGGKLFDGFKLCRLTARDYYSNDGHPNRSGYAKIAFCVTNAVKDVITGSRR